MEKREVNIYSEFGYREAGSDLAGEAAEDDRVDAKMAVLHRPRPMPRG